MFSFLSIEFALGFIAFFCVYWAFQSIPKIQNYLLVFASYGMVYLMANAIATRALAIFSLVIYLISYAMQQQPNHKKLWCTVGVICTIAHLSFWKYFDFFKSQVFHSLDQSEFLANIVLPLGISYYSFQAISYLVGRYKNLNGVAHLNLIDLFLHFSFFATITAGPIARIENTKGLTDIYNQPCGLSSQFQKTRSILSPTLAFGLLLLALIKKWWIAGWIADTWVNPIFSNPMQYQSLEILAAIYGYTLQLFLDFSGYSEMMIAFGLLLGFRLPVNFKAPLLAHNIRTFWDRWHISLSTWIRDYIYIPLGGSQKGFLRTQVHLITAMVLSGIWHGSGLNFLFWGLLHGVAIVSLNLSDKMYEKIFKTTAKQSRDVLYQSGLIGKVLGTFITIHFVCFSFVFFRAKNLDEALQVFQAMFANVALPWNNNPLYFLILLLVAWTTYPFAAKGLAVLQTLKLPKYRLTVPLFMVFLLILICAPSGIPGFIYANF